MQMVKIQIPDHPNRALATLEISRRGRIDSYQDHVYMVPEQPWTTSSNMESRTPS